MHDVIVVGAGPAGSTAARILSNKGLKILQLSKDVGKKDCAGILTSKYVKRYGIDDSYVERELGGLIIENPHHKLRLEFTGDYSIDRQKFDQHLFGLADSEQREEEVKDIAVEKDSVLVKTDKGSYRAGTVIAADGADSVIVKKLNLGQRRLAECAQGTAECKENYFHIFLNYVKDGYGWVAPKGDHCLVGIGSATQKPALVEFAAGIGMKVSKISYSKIPFYGPIKKIYSDRILIVGDAAGLVTPYEGEGIYYACRSAEIAAETVLNSESFSSYQRRWKREFGLTFSAMRFITPLINNHLFMDSALGISNNALVKKIISGMLNR